MGYELIGNEIWNQDKPLSMDEVFYELNLNSIAIEKCHKTFDTIRTVLDSDCANGDNLGDCVVSKINKQQAEIEQLNAENSLLAASLTALVEDRDLYNKIHHAWVIKKCEVDLSDLITNTPRVSADTEDLIDYSPPTGDELAEAERIANDLHQSGSKYQKVNFGNGMCQIFANGMPLYVFTNEAGCDAMLAKLRASELYEVVTIPRTNGYPKEYGVLNKQTKEIVYRSVQWIKADDKAKILTREAGE